MCVVLGRLIQGYQDATGTNTIKFMTLEEIREIPMDCTIIYARIVVDYRVQKKDPNRVCITVGGNPIEYPGELITQTVDLTTTKMMWNSAISTPAARYISSDVKNFYIRIPRQQFEYMRMPINFIRHEFIDMYD